MDTLIIVGAKYLFVIVLLCAMVPLIRLPSDQKRNYLILGFGSAVLAIILTKLAGRCYNDPRPFTQGVHALIAHEADNGFPSDHTVLSVTAALLCQSFDRKLGTLALVLAAIVGTCRVLSGVHHTIDVIASVVIALTAFFLASKLVERTRPKAGENMVAKSSSQENHPTN